MEKINIINEEIEIKFENFVLENLAFDNTGHDLSHAKRVVNNAKVIMKKEKNYDYDLIIASCYVHDVADHKLFVDLVAQYEKISSFLIEVGFSQQNITKVIDIIEHISYYNGKYYELTDINSMIVRDADRLDAIGAMGIIRTITYGASKNRPFYEDDNFKYHEKGIDFIKSTETTISHFYDKLLKLPGLMHTKVAKTLAKKRIKIIKVFLKQFYRELSKN